MAIDWRNEPVIDSVQLPGSETKYWVQDTEAREKIEDLVSATHFLGVTTTALEDGSNTNPIVINEQEVTAVSGDIAIYKKNIGLQESLSLEFIFDGTYWQLLGGQSIEGAGDLAYADTASTSYTPEGSILTNITTSDRTNVVTGVSLGNLNWKLVEQNASGVDYPQDGEVYVLTDINISSSSGFVNRVSCNTTNVGVPDDDGTLPTLTSVTTTGVNASISGTTLIFGSAGVSYVFDGGSFPTYPETEVVTSVNTDFGGVSIECSIGSAYISVSRTGNLYVNSGWQTFDFNGSAATITVTAD